MGTPKQKLVFYIGALLLLFHFFMLIAKQFCLTEKAQVYTVPFFDQNWGLFAPPPTENFRILVISEGKKIRVIDKASIADSEIGGLGGNEALMNALANAVHYSLVEGENVTNNEILRKIINNYLLELSFPEAQKIAIIATRYGKDQSPSVIII